MMVDGVLWCILRELGVWRSEGVMAERAVKKLIYHPKLAIPFVAYSNVARPTIGIFTKRCPTVFLECRGCTKGCR